MSPPSQPLLPHTSCIYVEGHTCCRSRCANNLYSIFTCSHVPKSSDVARGSCPGFSPTQGTPAAGFAAALVCKGEFLLLLQLKPGRRIFGSHTTNSHSPHALGSKNPNNKGVCHTLHWPPGLRGLGACHHLGLNAFYEAGTTAVGGRCPLQARGGGWWMTEPRSGLAFLPPG